MKIRKKYTIPTLKTVYPQLQVAIADWSDAETGSGDVDPTYPPIGGDDALVKRREEWNNGLW